MRYVFLLCVLCATVGLCQRARLGGLPAGSMVVTGEVDNVALQRISVVETNTCLLYTSPSPRD